MIVERIDDSGEYRVLADFLAKSYLPKEIVKTSGDYHHWAEAWAIESVRIAALAYRGITFGTVELDSNQRLARIVSVYQRTISILTSGSPLNSWRGLVCA